MTRKTRLCLAVSLALSATAVSAQDWHAKAAPSVQLRAERGETVDILIELRDAATLDYLAPGEFSDRVARAGQQLEAVADRSQRGLRAALDARGIEYRAFWVANAIAARVSPSDLAWIAARPEVAHIASDAPRQVSLPPLESLASQAKAIQAVQWNVTRVRAPEVWAAGANGEGVVVGDQDTGFQWDHPALKSKYRGWNGTSANHDYNWYDAIHGLLGSGTNPCGVDAPAPCADASHGTHTMGTILGDDGAGNQVGMAPGAKWIGCRNMERGAGRPSTYIECFEWFMAPRPVGSLVGGDPSRAPHIISNSWGCPVGPPPNGEDCVVDSIRQTIENVRNAGILVVVAAGNSGSSCSSVTDPPAIYAASFTIGATTSSDAIASYSGRGPVTVDGSNRLKPDITAPGSGIVSSVPGGGYASSSGTSMATPAVAGVAALLMSANPALKGNPAAVEQLLRQTAIPTTSAQNCGTFPGASIPNAVFGYGRIDAFAAYTATMATFEQPLFLNGFE
ncbi:MAG TPA: S8 family serine peptidase [Xanthomonadales bacterium]|nr:S8 family serine peptidase [Xanthomonadales bacterium]